MSKCLNSTSPEERSVRDGGCRPSLDSAGCARWLACTALSQLPIVARIAADRKLDIGRAATPAEIAGWDIDVRPDGQGLPPGSGLGEGRRRGLHGANAPPATASSARAPGAGRRSRAGRARSASHDPVKTVGSYFAHLSTVFDYVRHAMPFGDAQSLTNDELYAVVAYMLFLNDIVDEKFVLSQETFGSVKMPNAGGFYDDDRETTEKAFWNRALHDELQGRREDHRPRARDRRDAGRQAPASQIEKCYRTQLPASPRRAGATGNVLADVLGEEIGELLRVARQGALPVPQHGELEQQRIAPIGHAADAELAEVALQDRRE